jgi:hypothetical protein
MISAGFLINKVKTGWGDEIFDIAGDIFVSNTLVRKINAGDSDRGREKFFLILEISLLKRITLKKDKSCRFEINPGRDIVDRLSLSLVEGGFNLDNIIVKLIFFK